MSNRTWLWVSCLCAALGCAPVDEESAESATVQGGNEAGEAVALEQSLVPTARFNLSPNCEPRRATIQAVANRTMQLLFTARSDAQFTKWFGVLKSNTSVWNIYHTIVANIALYEQESMLLLGAASRETSARLIKFRCDEAISTNTIAEVVPDTFGTDHPTIRLTGRFFFELLLNSTPLKFDSQTSVLIHELAHLATGNKGDPMIGPGVNKMDYAKELAQTNPLAALQSPDNYGYYFSGL